MFVGHQRNRYNQGWLHFDRHQCNHHGWTHATKMDGKPTILYSSHINYIWQYWKKKVCGAMGDFCIKTTCLYDDKTYRHKSVCLSVCNWKTKHSQTCSVLNSFLSSTDWTVCPQNPFSVMRRHPQTDGSRDASSTLTELLWQMLEGLYGAERSCQWKTFNNVM
jgi:hypothetical protein